MTRRVFLTAVPVARLFAENPVQLNAIAAPVLPAQLTLPSAVAAKLHPRAGLVELRFYSDSRVKQALRATGIQFVEWGESLLFEFPSLEARARAWTEVTGKLRACPPYEFSLYRWS